MDFSSRVRSRNTICARSWFSQSLGSSASAFSSSSRFSAFGQSKMPPHQRKRRLDGIDLLADFRTHGFIRCHWDEWCSRFREN